MWKRRGRRFAIIVLMVCLALVRAERGVAELKGEPLRPSRLIRLSTTGEGYWDMAFLGMEARLFTRVVLWDGTRPLLATKRALPPR